MDGISVAESLFAEGRIHEAISALETGIVHHETPEKLAWLMQMRHSGFFACP